MSTHFDLSKICHCEQKKRIVYGAIGPLEILEKMDIINSCFSICMESMHFLVIYFS